MQVPEIRMQKSTIMACAVAVILFLLSGFGRDVLAAQNDMLHDTSMTANSLASGQ